MALGFKLVQAAGVFAAHLACSSWALADWPVAAGAVGTGGKPRAVFGVVPYAGSRARALRDAAAALTIPLTPITFTASKTNTSYTDTIVGYSPFPKGKVGETITMVVVPVVVQIGSTNFDPTAPDSCIAKDVSPLAALQGSPLLNPVTFDGQNVAGHASLVNGVNIGSATYADAVRRAEFWSYVGKAAKYHTDFTTVLAPTVTISSTEVTNIGGGAVFTTNCAPIGVIFASPFVKYLNSTVLPTVTEITPTTVGLFLMKDVVLSLGTQLNCDSGCYVGYHAATKNPIQTYAVAEYDTTSGYWAEPGITDISMITHELVEWLDDPLGTNPSPAWGNIGEVSGCDSVWENGDALAGTDFPAITMPNGISYHPQEMVFWSWFFNAENTPSTGAGGKFSMNGTFAGPAQGCPPGGTF